MASCSGNGARGHHTFTLNVWETGTNQSANTSTVSWNLVLSPIQNGWNWNISGITYSVNVDGNVANGSIDSYDGYSTVTIASGSKTIGHNSDGSKWIGFSFNVNDSRGLSYTPGNASGSGGLTLTKINRYAIVTNATDFTDETNPTITFNNSGGYRINARLEFAGSIIQRDNIPNTGSYTFDLTTEERNLLRSKTPNSNSMAVREVIATYINSSTETHWSWQDKTMTIINANPIFEDFTYQDTNTTITTITGDNQAIVKGLSTLQISVPVADKMEAQKYATPVKYVSTIDTLTGTANYSSESIATINLGTVKNAGTKRLSVRAYDSRNNSTEVYKDIVVYDYEKPVVNATVERENNFEANTTIKVSGTYSPLTINNIDKNVVTAVQYRYREKGDTWGSWNNIVFTATGGNYTATDTVVSLDSGKEFEVEIKATDNFRNTTTTKSVDVGQSIFFISTSQKECYINNERVLTEADVNNNYDLDEIDTGKKWINGETIYRKVLEINPTSDYDFYSHNINNFDKLIKAYGRCTRPSGDYYQQIIPCTYTNWEIYLYDFTTSGFRLRFSANQWNAGVDDIYIVLEYTKTTN